MPCGCLSCYCLLQSLFGWTPFLVPIRHRQHHGVNAKLSDPPPMDGVEFVYGLNISRCIVCRKCVHACVKENNQSRQPEIQYIRVLEMEKGSINVETANHHYDARTVPRGTIAACGSDTRCRLSRLQQFGRRSRLTHVEVGMAVARHPRSLARWTWLEPGTARSARTACGRSG